MRAPINFALKPFVQRDARLMAWWIANACALLLCLFVLVQYLSLRNTNQSLHHQLGAMTQSESELQVEMASTLRRLESLDLQQYKREVEQFHAIQTAFQADWGEILDGLNRHLNDDVRLVRLQSSEAPQNEAESVAFALAAEARNKDAELRFVQSLQADPAFRAVRFEVETYGPGKGLIQFEIRFQFERGGSRG
ncbi:MAG: hypothetical protein H6510_17920 [Acidobacteria bacterium]|nr:hypothetical protein [Acidobacteriota bacterium]MCB9399695.1 hypothetical protein [Acidobacteriota bacterium]